MAESVKCTVLTGTIIARWCLLADLCVRAFLPQCAQQKHCRAHSTRVGFPFIKSLRNAALLLAAAAAGALALAQVNYVEHMLHTHCVRVRQPRAVPAVVAVERVCVCVAHMRAAGRQAGRQRTRWFCCVGRSNNWLTHSY